MDHIIVHSLEPITLVGGGQVTLFDLEEALKFAPRLIAVDAGLDRALDVGVMPEAVIGDMDSVSDLALSQLREEQRHLVAEQESTDFDKALRHVNAPAVVAVGFTGGRLDHQLAALHTLVARADRPCILLSENEITFCLPPKICLPTEPGDVVSLFPMARVTGRSRGLFWEIDALTFEPASRVGTSNCAQGEVELIMDGPGMLGLFPRRLIRQVVAALSEPNAARWPARAERYRDLPTA